MKLIQELNRSIILNMIREYGPISRSEIAERNGISPSTVAAAVTDLMKERFVYEAGTGNSKGGRKPIMLRFSPDNHYILGVSITNSNVTFAEMNMEAIIRRKSISNIDHLDNQMVIPHLLNLLEKFICKCPTDKECKGISVIVPGIVDTSKGIIHLNTNINLKDVRLKEMIEERFKITTWVENDTNAIVLAEKKFGKYNMYNNLLFVTIGEGVGAGIIMNESIFRGGRGDAGEFGHTSIDRDGIRCDCGNIGCLENYVSWSAVHSRIVSLISKGRSTEMADAVQNNIALITPAVFRNAVMKGDSLATDIMTEVADYLSVGIVNLIHLFNPELIIIGGSIGQDNEVLIQKIDSYVRKHALTVFIENLKIYPTTLGEDTELVGAGSILLQDLFLFSLSSDAGIYR
ncbi:MAG: ROK family transcriptional regulator [Candidatus Cohnella colombiensis]|uniref:ROK family transcriptional regulator n=1 Tax=Candidatus Cohnella colombiensis TaxID=3121368 RepID=A0AA95JHF0_9BACL|nr:MAG: ROK family transcriptional regulator [Cohnella sp.]